MKTIKRLCPLLVLIAFAAALAVDPPNLKIVELSDQLQLGIKALTSEDAVNYALGVTSSDIEDLYVGQQKEYRQRLEGAGLPNPGEPLYIDSPLKLDSDPPDDQRIRKVLADKAKRYLLKQGLNKSDPDFSRWLELTQKWMWRDVLAKYGPRYLVPLFNERDECLATMIVYAWAQQGSISTTLTACPRDYPYLSKGDALRRLADEGIEPVNNLRPVFIPAQFQRWPVRACNSANTSADTLIGVWTDGFNAIGMASGNVYQLSNPFESLDDLRQRLKYTIRNIETPDEDPRNIVPDYQGFLRLIACGDPHQANTAEGQINKTDQNTIPETPTEYISWDTIEEIPTDRFLSDFANFWGDNLTIDEIRDVVRDPQKLTALAKYSPDSRALDTLEVGPLLRAESLVHLPENPPQTAFAKLLIRAAAKSRQQLFLEYESAPPLEQAEEDVWDELRIQTGPHFYFTLHDPETGLCIALLSSPALKKGMSASYTLMECPSNTVSLNAEAAAKFLDGLEPGGNNHPLQLVLIPTRPEGNSLRCDPFMYKGPYWSNGSLAVNAFSHNVYRVLPTGIDWIENPPSPYLQTNRMVVNEKQYEFLTAYLPLKLELILCHQSNWLDR